jgi:hypothetical protein
MNSLLIKFIGCVSFRSYERDNTNCVPTIQGYARGPVSDIKAGARAHQLSDTGHCDGEKELFLNQVKALDNLVRQPGKLPYEHTGRITQPNSVIK